MHRSWQYAAAVLLAAAVSGCQTSAADQQKATLALTAGDLSIRQIQARRFDTADEAAILAGATGVMQDLGFTIEESSVANGLLVGSKNRDAVEAGQVAGQLFLATLIAAFGGPADPVWERDQRIRISVSSTPVKNGIVVRANIQRVIWNTKNQISRVQTISDPAIYQQFFDKLSQSVFLVANDI